MATAEFNYSGTTYGRSSSGLKTLISSLQTKVKEASEAMTGSEYNKFLNEIRKNWSGTDATAFIKAFQDDIKNAKNSIKSYSGKLETVLNNDRSAFLKMQKSNISKI